MKSHLLLSVCALVLLSGSARGESLLRGIPEIDPGSDAVAAQEDALFRTYLGNGRDEAGAERELALLRAQRHESRARFDRRWWGPTPDQVRARAYFDRYYLGMRAAREAVGDALNAAACATVRALRGADAGDSALNEAYRRGVEAAYPICFRDADFTAVRALSTRLTQLERGLFEVKKRVAAHRPDEVERDELARALNDELSKLVLGEAEKARAALATALELDPELLARVDRTASELSQAISCPTLRSRQGEVFVCKATFLPAVATLGTTDMLRIAYQGQQLGPFQKRLVVDSLLKAVNVYLTEVRPTDQLARFLASNLTTELAQLDQRLDERLAAILAEQRRATDEAFARFAAKQRVLHQRFFGADERSSLLDVFFALRADLSDYLEWQAGSAAERAQLRKLAARYDSLLDDASAIALRVSLPRIPLLMQVGESGENVAPPYVISELGTAWLLGADEEEVDYWRDALRFAAE